MAGKVGFGPTNAGVKDPCLNHLATSLCNGIPSRIRTDDTTVKG